jgi:hypothetical protein
VRPGGAASCSGNHPHHNAGGAAVSRSCLLQHGVWVPFMRTCVTVLVPCGTFGCESVASRSFVWHAKQGSCQCRTCCRFGSSELDVCLPTTQRPCMCRCTLYHCMLRFWPFLARMWGHHWPPFGLRHNINHRCDLQSIYHRHCMPHVLPLKDLCKAGSGSTSFCADRWIEAGTSLRALKICMDQR